LARLAVIEEIAWAAATDDERRWLVWRRAIGGGAEVHSWPSGAAVADVATEGQAAHIARWAPDHVLAWSAAFREIVAATDDPSMLSLLDRILRVDDHERS